MVTAAVKRFRARKAAQALARARKIIGKRNSGLIAPVRTGGFYGSSTIRGRAELKTIDVDTALTAVSQAGALQLLNGIATGTDFTARIGRKIIMKSLFFRAHFFPSATVDSPTGTFVRLLIFYDCQSNSAAPIVGDVLTIGAYDSPMNLNNRDRFKVIYDKFINMSATDYTAGALTTGDPIPKQLQKYKKLNMEVVFSGIGATVASIQTGSVYALLIASADLTVAADSYFRIRFMDL